MPSATLGTGHPTEQNEHPTLGYDRKVAANLDARQAPTGTVGAALRPGRHWRPGVGAPSLHVCCTETKNRPDLGAFSLARTASASGANGIRTRGPHLFRLTWSPLVKPPLTRSFVRPLATSPSVPEWADMSHIGLLCCPYVARREAQGWARARHGAAEFRSRTTTRLRPLDRRLRRSRCSVDARRSVL